MIKPGALLAAILLSACSIENSASHPPPATPAAPDSARLTGNVDVRPYTAVIAYAVRRPDGNIDIKAFDRQVGPDIGCQPGEQGLVDTQRTIWIQMQWPAPKGSVWSSTINTPNPNHAGVFFTVRRGLGGSGQRAEGEVRILDASNSGGVLFVDAATANQVEGVHGSVRGELPFTICG